LWLVPTLLATVLSCSLVGYGAGYFDAKEARRQPLAPAPVAMPSPPVAIVDIASGITDVYPLLGLRPGEQVVAINDNAVRADQQWRLAVDLEHSGLQFSGYWDVTTDQRRIVVLFH
jgi:hypothetical protein